MEPKPPDKTVALCGLWKDRKLPQQLIKIEGKIAGQTAIFLIDCGATTEFLDKDFVNRHQLGKTDSQTTIKLADGKTSTSAGLTQELQCALRDAKQDQDHRFKTRFEITTLNGYDAILGLTWFQAMQPQFKWGQPITVQLRRKTRRGKFKWSTLRNHIVDTHTKQTAAMTQAEPEQTRSDSGEGMIYRSIVPNQQALKPPSQEHVAVVKEEEHIEQEQQRTTDFQIGPAEAALQNAQRTQAEEGVYQYLINKFKEVFPSELPAGLPPNRGEHRIQLKPHSQAPYRRPYKTGPTELRILKATLDELEGKGFIQKSVSRYGAPTMFTPKKDGTPRMVVDYRELNKITVKNGYPLPNPDELFPLLAGAKYFSKIDLHSGYYQIPIAKADREKTAFVTRYGSYEFLVLPMGLRNSPGTFMDLMNTVFNKQLDKFVLVFLDDIVIFSNSLEEHKQHLEEVLTILKEQKLYAKISKCNLVRQEIEFLGYLVGNEGLRADPRKIQTVTDWPVPQDITDIRSFLGCAGFYRKFIKDFATIALPLTNLTGKYVKFKWGDEEQEAFDILKQKMDSAEVLQLPDAKKPFTIHTDASAYATGAVLQQDSEEGLRPIAYLSEKMIAAERNYPVHEQEMLAIVKACKHWRHLLWGQRTIIFSDHDSLRHFFGQRQFSKRQVRWLEQLAEFDIHLNYVKGEDNPVADALSRRKEWLESPEEVTNLQARRQRGSSVDLEVQRQNNKDAATKILPAGSTVQQPDHTGAIVMPSQRCVANNKRGVMCGARTKVGQYCWNHLKQQEQLRVKDSQIPNAGKGLFAERVFRRHERITLYTGDWMGLVEDESGGAYALQVTRTQIIDAARTNAAPGRWANDPRNTGRRANAKFCYDRSRRIASLKAMRRINQGEEILVSYIGRLMKRCNFRITSMRCPKPFQLRQN